jgi:hypothetical protein
VCRGGKERKDGFPMRVVTSACRERGWSPAQSGAGGESMAELKLTKWCSAYICIKVHVNCQMERVFLIMNRNVKMFYVTITH